MAQLAGWAGFLVVIVAYAISIRREDPRAFHLGNVVGSIGLGIAAADVGAWPSLVLTLTFGVLGLVGLVRDTEDAA